jgi:hypothetical protein
MSGTKNLWLSVQFTETMLCTNAVWKRCVQYKKMQTMLDTGPRQREVYEYSQMPYP